MQVNCMCQNIVKQMKSNVISKLNTMTCSDCVWIVFMIMKVKYHPSSVLRKNLPTLPVMWRPLTLKVCQNMQGYILCYWVVLAKHIISILGPRLLEYRIALYPSDSDFSTVIKIKNATKATKSNDGSAILNWCPVLPIFNGVCFQEWGDFLIWS